MTGLIAQLDEWGRPAWIAAIVLGFILWWPIGLAILAYMIWSRRMNCGRRGEMSRWQARMGEKWRRGTERWAAEGPSSASSGNRAFDEYRAETMRRLEDEEREFRTFLDRLRAAKDRAEFDDFMAGRKKGPGETPAPSAEPPA